MDNKIKVELKSILENVAIARNIAQLFLIERDPEMHFINEVKTIISEAVTNAIIHGYEGKDNKIVTLILSRYDDLVEIIISDTGVGIPDVELALEPMYTTKPTDDRSGLGFTIMQIFCDEFNCTSNEFGTTITMKKNFSLKE